MRQQLTIISLIILCLTGTAFADQDESIYVVQKRAFSKKGKLEISPIIMASLNNKFVGFYGPAVSGAYHIRENFALQFSAGYALGYYSSMVYEVQIYEDLIPDNADLKQLRWFGSVGVQWSPIYGKLRLIPGILGDFDIYLSAGIGIADTREPCETSEASCKALDQDLGFGLRTPEASADRFKITGNFGVGLRVFFADWLGVRFEVYDISYGEKVDHRNGTDTDIRNNIAAFIGASFLF